jgi:hypothetical protein
MLPAELPAAGSVNARSLFRETNILYALEQMKTQKWKTALLHLQKSETWPDHLGSGEPYNVDNRITHFLIAYCCEQLKDKVQADKSFAYMKNFKNPNGRTSSLGNQLTKLVEGGDRNFKTITETLLKASGRDRDKDFLTIFLTVL